MTSSPDLRQWVRDIPDFPKPGILFRDLTPMLRDPRGLAAMVAQLAPVCERLQPELIVGIESRGFIVGSALAAAQGLGFVPVRKPGKLPGAVTGVDYDLEYGSDRLEIHSDALGAVTSAADARLHESAPEPTCSGRRVLVVDDLLATGGTAAAAAELIRVVGGDLCGFAFVIELEELQGRGRLPDGVPVDSLILC